MHSAHHQAGSRLHQRGHLEFGAVGLLFGEFRQTKIENLHVAVLPDHYVLGLDVPVNDAGRVRSAERIGNLHNHVKSFVKSERLLVNRLPQRLAGDELRGYEVRRV
jgi:hypothetical protein